MKKSIVSTLIKTLAFTSVALCSAVNANESSVNNISTAKVGIKISSEDKIGIDIDIDIDIDIGLGGIFTNLDGYHGEGFNISARVDMPLLIPENKWQLGIDVQVSYQTSELKNNGFIGSMSKKGCYWDNAVAESFFGSLKQERVHLKNYETRYEAQQNVINYITILI